jgi:hypothetical protein
MLQYIPFKHSKFGVKFWVLAESITGYIIRMSCYLGKKFDPVAAGTKQGTTVVMDLMRESHLLNKGYHVYCDSFFTSLDLAKKLLDKGTRLTGTLRGNRRLPRSIKEATVHPGTNIYMRQGETLLTAHRGEFSRRPVRLLSTGISADTRQGVPEVVKRYNKNMGGVDGADMVFSFYSNNRKSLKVWKKMAFHIIQRMLLNAYVLYSQNVTGKVKTRQQFCRSVIESLASRHFQALGNERIPAGTCHRARATPDVVNLSGNLCNYL